MIEHADRDLVVLVGPESKTRARLAREILDRDTAVVLCAGPPGCALLRSDACALVDVADAVVVLPSASHDRETIAGLSLCAQRACNAVVMDPSPVTSDVRAVHVKTPDTTEAAGIVTSVLRHPSARRRETRA